jgi:molecular chaperone DnaK
VTARDSSTGNQQSIAIADSHLLTPAQMTSLLEIYRDRTQLQDNTRLTLDQWDALNRSVHRWLDQYGSLNWRATDIEAQVQLLLEEGDRLRQRTQDGRVEVIDMAATYQKWLSVLENLPINPAGNPEELAQHFVRLQRYSNRLFRTG